MARGPRQRTAPDTVVVVDKPPGMTSHDVVGRVRRLVGSRRVGHAGTLDPMATGVLVLGVERATRLLTYVVPGEKAYDATIRLGVGTVSDDAEGAVTAERDASGVSDDAVTAGVRALTGELDQVPSAVSAIKVDGVRAYRTVREGGTVDLAARRITVSAFEVHDIRRAGATVDVDVSVVCSAGTYVRALARDLGAALGVGGHLTALRRTRVGPFDLAQARTLAQLEADAARGPIGHPLVDAVRQQLGLVAVDEATTERVRHGAVVPAPGVDHGREPVGVVDPGGTLLALARRDGELLRPLVVFA